jgi:hypothetical protein
MEVVTSMEIELEICVTYLHEGYIDWLKRPQRERHILKRWWVRHRSKEGYFNTPKEDRMSYLFR